MNASNFDGEFRNSKVRRRAPVLAGLLGLGVGLAGVYAGCLSFDERCMTDEGVFICDPVDCDEDDILCQEPLAERKVVDNWRAGPGDVTVCPFTGETFEVEHDSSRVAYEGYSFVFYCSGECIEIVEADRRYYLDDLVVAAGGPASDPDPSPGGAIEDER